MEPDDLLCSCNARPQEDGEGAARVPFQERETSKLGRIIYIVRCAQ
jgi:hypothetical protein